MCRSDPNCIFIMQTTRVRPLPGNCTLDKSDGSFLFVVRTFSIFPNLFRECHGSLVLLAKYRFMSEPSTFINKSHILIWLPRVRDCPLFGILAEMPWAGLKREVFYFLKSQDYSSGFYHSYVSGENHSGPRPKNLTLCSISPTIISISPGCHIGCPCNEGSATCRGDICFAKM